MHRHDLLNQDNYHRERANVAPMRADVLLHAGSGVLPVLRHRHLEIERLLSPAFIRGPIYGTRCSTVVTIHRDGSVMFEERSFGPDGSPTCPSILHQLPATPT